MFMKQATTDRLLGMLVTLATGAAIFYIQHRIKLFVNRKKSGGANKGDRATKKATDYGDPYFRARWGRKGYGSFELVHHQGSCMCGRFAFRLLAPQDLKALDCPGRVRYPHIFVPVGAFQPLTDLRLLTLYSARSTVVAHVVVHAFCSACGVPVFRASDGAIDTLVVNIECLKGESIRSLEVTYYEDLLGFPREGEEGVDQGGGGGGGGQYAHTHTPKKGSPTATAAAAAEARRNSNDGALVRSTRGGGAGGGLRWTEVVETVLPVRSFFGSSSTSTSRSPSPPAGLAGLGPVGSALSRTGATSLFSHLLSRASLATRPPSSGPLAIETCRMDGGEEGGMGGGGLGSNSSSDAGEGSPPSSSSSMVSQSDMWHSWDESCEARRAGGVSGAGRGWGVGSGGGSGGGGISTWSTSSGTTLNSRHTTPAKVTASSATAVSSRLPGNAHAHTHTHTHTTGWERMSEGCTPPSMHQLRYHLKRHLKRRLNWLNNNNMTNGGGGGGMPSTGMSSSRHGSPEVDTSFPLDHYYYHYPQSDEEEEEEEEAEQMDRRRQPQPPQQPSQPHQQQHHTSSSPAFSSAPSTPLADSTGRHTSSNNSQPSSASSSVEVKRKSKKLLPPRGGESNGGGGGGEENAMPVHMPLPTPVGGQKGGKAD